MDLKITSPPYMTTLVKKERKKSRIKSYFIKDAYLLYVVYRYILLANGTLKPNTQYPCWRKALLVSTG